MKLKARKLILPLIILICIVLLFLFTTKGKSSETFFSSVTSIHKSNPKTLAKQNIERAISTVTSEINNRKVTYSIPDNTNANKVSVSVKNASGTTYKYKIYKQNAPYDSYEKYMAYHGCSTCALTTLLNAKVPELSDYSPDKVISVVEKNTFGDDTFNKNYSKKLMSQMPVTLYGVTQILDKYNININTIIQMKLPKKKLPHI